MASVHETKVSLRFFGDDLDPDEITRRLGRDPSTGIRKGEKWSVREGVEPRPWPRTGSWRLKAEVCQPGDLEGQIWALLQTLNDDPDIWQELTTRFTADLFCGLFMDGWNEGLSLSPKLMMALAARNLSIGFDIYGQGESSPPDQDA